jgi:hypothetical protein
MLAIGDSEKCSRFNEAALKPRDLKFGKVLNSTSELYHAGYLSFKSSHLTLNDFALGVA